MSAGSSDATSMLEPGAQSYRGCGGLGVSSLYLEELMQSHLACLDCRLQTEGAIVVSLLRLPIFEAQSAQWELELLVELQSVGRTPRAREVLGRLAA